MAKVYKSIEELNGGIPVSNINPELSAYNREYTSSYKKLGKFDSGLLPGMNQEHLRAFNQSGWDLIGTGALRLVGSTLAKTAEGFASALTGFNANPISQGIADLERQMLDEWLPVYKSIGGESDNLLDRLKSGDWWASTGVDGFAFMLSAIIGTKGLNAVTKIPKIARLAKTLGASDDVLMNLDKFQRSTVGKMLALDKPGVALSTAYNAFNEAGFEARAVYDKVKEELAKEKYGSEYEYLNGDQKAFVDNVAGNQAKNTFFYNLPMLFLSERIFSETILGNFFGLPEASAFKRLTKDGAEVSLKNLTKGQKAALIGLPFAANIPTEAFQENYQLAVENYFSEKGKLGEKLDLLELENLSGIGKGMLNNFSTIEGKESMFLGGLLGGVGSLFSLGGMSKSEKKAQEYIGILNKGLTNLNKSGVRFFKTKDDGSILFNEAGEPVMKDKEEIMQMYKELSDDYSKYIFSTTLEMFNESGTDVRDIVEIDKNNSIKDLSFHFFQTEGGRELFDKFLDDYADKIKKEYGAEYADKNVDEVRKELAKEVDKLQSLYNLADKYYKLDSNPESLPIQYHSLWKQSEYQKLEEKYRKHVRDNVKNLPDDVRFKIEDILEKTSYYTQSKTQDINKVIDDLTKDVDTKIPGYDSLLLNTDLKKLISLNSLYESEKVHFKKELTDSKYYENLKEKVKKQTEEEEKKAKDKRDAEIDAEDAEIVTEEEEGQPPVGTPPVQEEETDETEVETEIPSQAKSYKSVEEVDNDIKTLKEKLKEEYNREIELIKTTGKDSKGQSVPLEIAEQMLPGILSKKYLPEIQKLEDIKKKLQSFQPAKETPPQQPPVEKPPVTKTETETETKDIEKLKTDIVNILSEDNRIATTIARKLGLKIDEVQPVLDELVKNGVIEKSKNVYKLVKKETTLETAPQEVASETTTSTDTKADVPIGKVGNTNYEVKSDGVYFEGKKLDNPKNKTHRQLIEADIKRRSQEDLEKQSNFIKQQKNKINEDSKKTKKVGKWFTVDGEEAPIAPNDVAINDLDMWHEKQGHILKYEEKPLINIETELDLLEKGNLYKIDKINAKYDAELDALKGTTDVKEVLNNIETPPVKPSEKGKDVLDEVPGESESILEEDLEEDIDLNERNPRVIKTSLKNKLVLVGDYITTGFNKMAMRVVKMKKTITNEGGITLVNRVNEVDAQGNPILESNETSSTAYMHSKVNEGDKIIIRVPSNYMDIPININLENNETITFRELMSKTDIEGYLDLIINNLPLEIIHGNEVFIGYIHNTDWINPTNVKAEEKELENQKAILYNFRKKFINTDGTIKQDIVINSVITGKTLGKLLTSNKRLPLSKAVPNLSIVLVKNQKQVINLITGKIEEIKNKKAIKSGSVGFISNGYFIPAIKRELNEEDKATLYNEIIKPEGRDLNKIESMLNVIVVENSNQASKSKFESFKKGVVIFNKQFPNDFFIYMNGALYKNDTNKLTEYFNNKLYANIDTNKSDYNRNEWIPNALITNIREIEANYDGNVEHTIFIHPLISFNINGKVKNVNKPKEEFKKPEKDNLKNKNRFLKGGSGFIGKQETYNQAEKLLRTCNINKTK